MKKLWKQTKKLVFILVFFLILFLFYREIKMNFSNDAACKILSEEKFLNSYSKTNKYQQADPENPIYAYVEFDFEYELKESTELIVYGRTGNVVPYKGKAKKLIKLVFEKDNDDAFFHSTVSVRVFDKKQKALCSYVSEIGIRLPNIEGGNKFLFKMTHPYDDREPLSSFSLIHLP